MHKHLFLKTWEFFFYDFTENIFCAFDLELFSSFFVHNAQMGSFRGLPQSPLLSSALVFPPFSLVFYIAVLLQR